MSTLTKLPRPIVKNWQWQSNAACRGMDVALFFHADSERGPSRRQRDLQAKAVCASCPVRQTCLNWALSIGELHGVWGGKSADERRDLLAPSRRRT